ncbi:uncharacterized protein ARMOST_20232 [Armillaria ostoyae]|uniref:DUF6535 domain-containing protein n=1 Tax=Armillaria ostoyae TaxID=47428 RepID=A0A284S6S0_ARMOS|nr:uncharacterized protein ARMOST_20232 [Armillaria ostoyae]
MAQAERISARTGLNFFIVIQMSPALMPMHFHGHGPTGGTVAIPSIDIVPDIDDENLQSLPHDTQGDTRTSDDPVGDFQPEAQQPARTAHSQQKSTRHFFGIPQRGPQVKGNDPLDYEQRFPEDKQYEELGPLARVWRTYLEECGAFDIEMLEGWRDGLDVLLVFAGLFSAVVTTFVVQTSQNLQVDYSQVTATLLFELIDVQRAAANGTLVNDVPRSDLTPFSDFRPTIADSLVNGLWFTSLSFSLATALFAVLTKQWIHQYIAMPSGTPRDRCRVRQFRYMGLEQWGVGFIIGLLPLLLSMSLGIFLVGLVLFLVPLQRAIASIVGTITLISFAAYFVSNFLPIMYPSCPYKTPLSQYIFLSYAYIVRLITLVSLALTPKKPPPRKFRDIERAAVELRGDNLDVYALGWLSNMSSNPSVQNIVIQSTSALPLRSVEPLMQYAERFSKISCRDFDHMAMTGQESIIERLIRVSLRFGTRSRRLTEIDWPSIETYTEVLCVDYRNSSRTDEIANIVKAQFMASDQQLCLQPIVWAHLLQTLLPFTLESGLIPLFLMIPLDYWRADYKPPPLFPKNKMTIRSISDEDHCAVSLQTAVYNHLYPDIADALVEGFTHVEDSIFHPDPATDEFPAPQDARLLSLLTLAGSPSIRKTAINPSMEDLFVQVLGNIDTYMMGFQDIHSNHETPFELDSNRYAVLKLLYMLLSSDDLGTTMMVDNQRTTLMLFLWVLNSTTPHPRFLPSDWCTPTMAFNFTQIAYQDQAWTLSSDHMTLQFVYEFLQLDGPIANQILSRFVSERLLDYVVELRRDEEVLRGAWRLQGILGAFVSRVRRLDAAVAYLFELDNIFAVCAMFIMWKDIPRLRLLAQCCPDHPVWIECLQKLNTIPEHFQLDLVWYNREEILSTVSDFRALVEGGEPPTLNSWSTVSSLWRRLRRQHWNVGKESTGADKV